MKQQIFGVTGMSCAACSARVDKVVGSLSGVSSVQVSLLTHSMRIRYDEAQLSDQDIIAAVEHAGYGASLSSSDSAEESATRARLSYSLMCLIPMVCLHHIWQSPLSVAAQFVLLVPILYLNRKFFIAGTQAALHRAPNMDTLVALGAAAGIVYSIVDIFILQSGTTYVESAGMILTLITLGKWLESRATSHTGDALTRMKALLPKTAMVVQDDGCTQTVPIESVQVGDIILIAAGARVPLDSTVTDGSSAIDESALTGESMPVLKQTGSKVYAGTINGNGALTAKVRCSREESTMSGIIQLVGEAAASKAPIARMADQIASIFVPTVVGISLLTAAVWLACGASLPFAMGCAIAVLVISCPCALGLATPVAIMAGAGKAAENGILFRNGETMENARKADVIILDKTGTLTTGHPVVVQVTPADKVTKSKLLQLASSLEHSSSHPLAEAVRKASYVYTPIPPEQTHYLPGRGIQATIEGRAALAGNASLMSEHSIAIPTVEAGGMTPLYFALDGQYMGMMLIADTLKSDSAAAVAAMKSQGLQVLMMSGDHAGTVQRIANQAGIDEYFAGVTPHDKEAKVRELQAQGHCVAMVGDGINDAPALVRADVGIAIGAGTDVAMESAGIILVRSELTDAVNALKLSRAVVRTIRQNLFWAFFYNVLAIPLAAGLYYPMLGWLLSPGVAAAAMSLSSLFVVCNALRLGKLILRTPNQQTMNTITISVEGMMCPHCERHVVQALCALPGISEVRADYKSATVSLHTESAVDEILLATTIREAGYEFKGIC